MNPIIEVFQKGEIAQKGGLDYLVELHKADNDRLSLGGVKFVVDGSLQGYTGLLQWPYYYKSFKNGVANISQDDLNKGVLEVHKRGLQAVIHTNGDQATEMALTAVAAAERQYSAAHQPPPLRARSAGDEGAARQNESTRRRDEPLHQPHLLLGRPALFHLPRPGPGKGHGSRAKCAEARHSIQPAFRRVGHAGRSAAVHVDRDRAQDHVGARAGRRGNHHRRRGAARRDARRRLPSRTGRQEGLDHGRQARRFHCARPQSPRGAIA